MYPLTCTQTDSQEKSAPFSLVIGFDFDIPFFVCKYIPLRYIIFPAFFFWRGEGDRGEERLTLIGDRKTKKHNTPTHTTNRTITLARPWRKENNDYEYRNNTTPGAWTGGRPQNPHAPAHLLLADLLSNRSPSPREEQRTYLGACECWTVNDELLGTLRQELT